MSNLQHAIALQRSGQFPTAEVERRALLAQGPTDHQVQHFLGVLLLQINRAEEAIQLLREAIERGGENSTYFNNLAVAYHPTRRRG